MTTVCPKFAIVHAMAGSSGAHSGSQASIIGTQISSKTHSQVVVPQSGLIAGGPGGLGLQTFGRFRIARALENLLLMVKEYNPVSVLEFRFDVQEYRGPSCRLSRLNGSISFDLSCKRWL